MNVNVPYVPELLSPELEKILPENTSWIAMLRDDDYARLIRDLQRRQERVIIVEHDILPTPAQLEELWECPEPWCAYAYKPFADRDYSEPQQVVAFGLSKFSDEFWKHVWLEFPAVRWDHCDFVFTAFARQFGMKPHQHYGEVNHLLTRHGDLWDHKTALGWVE